jgi:Kef-type K+ transport system membrane component KefB
MKLEDHIAPISHRFLIPIFFVSLGLQVQWRTLVSLNALLAVGVAGVLLGLREVIHRRCLRSSATDSTYLLFCPNLTLVALAANALLQQSNATEPVAWLLLAGLFITVPSILFLPAASGDETSPGTHTPPANPPDGSPAAVLAENVRVH